MSNDDLPPASSGKLREILNDPAKLRKLKVELAITVDAMRPFVNTTYKLEGDGALSLIVYEQLSMLYASISTQHYPNVVAVLEKKLLAMPPTSNKFQPTSDHVCNQYTVTSSQSSTTILNLP